MRRILFNWAGFEIYSYPAMLYLGLVLGIVAGDYMAHLARLDAGRVFAATILLVIPALAGARLFHVALYWKFYRRMPKRIWRRSEGGGSLYGGLPLTLLLSLPLLNLLRLPFGAFWDVATFTILIGMIVTRIGCFLNGCCSGRPSDSCLAIYSPNHLGVYARRLPTQLLEALWAAVLLTGAMLLWNRLLFVGALFLYALGGYGLGRFLLELTREQQYQIRTVKVQRVISACLCAFAVIFLSVAWRK